MVPLSGGGFEADYIGWIRFALEAASPPNTCESSCTLHPAPPPSPVEIALQYPNSIAPGTRIGLQLPEPLLTVAWILWGANGRRNSRRRRARKRQRQLPSQRSGARHHRSGPQSEGCERLLELCGTWVRRGVSQNRDYPPTTSWSSILIPFRSPRNNMLFGLLTQLGLEEATANLTFISFGFRGSTA